MKIPGRLYNIASDIDEALNELRSLNIYIHDPALMHLHYKAEENLQIARAALHTLAQHYPKDV